MSAAVNAALWETQSDNKLEMRPDGSWFSVTESRTPIDVDAVLNEFAKKQGYLTPLLGPGTFAYLEGDDEIVMKVIDKVPFVTQMIVDLEAMQQVKDGEEGTTIYRPAFDVSGIETDLFTYVPPKTMRLILIGDTKYRHSLYLVAQHTGTGQLYHPILPNIYGNGRICMGGAQHPEFNPMKGLDHFLFNIFKNWSEAKWNRDLVGEVGTGIYSWLKFDDKTKKNIVPKEAWETFSRGKIAPTPIYCTALGRLHSLLA